MGSFLSTQADTQQQSEVSPTSQNDENHNSGVTASTRLNDLPHNCEAILKDADTVIDMSSNEQLYAGVFLNKKRKKYWVDKASHGNCFFQYARDLLVIWGEDHRYWLWSSTKETSEDVVDVPELLNVCWLEIIGNFEISKLTPGVKYEVVFVVMLKDPSYGWESPVNLKLVLPDGNKQEHKVSLSEKPRSMWFEIPVGDFMVEPKKGRFIEFSLYQYDGFWKKGLVVKGAAIRPKR